MRNSRAALIAVAALGMSAFAADPAQADEAPRPLRDAFRPTGKTTTSSMNGGRRGKGMAAKRASVKARNVRRNRAAHRG